MNNFVEKKENAFLLKFVLIVSSLALMVDMAIYPAVDAIYQDFADINMVLVNFFITGPALLIIIGSIICGLLVQIIGKKTILAASYLLFCISTIFSSGMDNFYFLLAMRTIAGLTAGFISVSSVGLIAELFIDENRRSRMMGLYTAVMSILGAIMTYAAGWLAIINWHYVFYAYIIAIPVLVGVIFFIPKTAPERKTAIEGSTPDKMPWKRTSALAIAAFIFSSMYSVILTMVAVYLVELSIGDSSTVGLLEALGALGSMVTGFAFSFIYMRTKRATPIIFAGLMAVGYLMLAYTINLPMICIAKTILGGMYGLGYAYYLMAAAMIAPPSKASLSISIANSAVYGGIFVGPYVCPLIQYLFHVDSIVACMPYMVLILIGYVMISAAIVIYTKKKQGNIELI
ncbi:MAG: MFS transporter [Clostridiales bacterium]